MISKILKNNTCAGCGLCQSIFGENKISVELNKEGFYRPNVNLNLNKNEDKLLAKVCPAIRVKKDKTISPKKDVVWGEMFSSFVCSSSDEEIRSEASSGGGISAILVYLLETKKVSAVIHIGASKEIPYLNDMLRPPRCKIYWKTSGNTKVMPSLANPAMLLHCDNTPTIMKK
jgi:coenzyme F420 hydrogenase subunit beta